MICAEEVLSIVDRFALSLNEVCQQLNDDVRGKQNDSLNTDGFWNSFVGCVKLISHDSTKIGMMFNDDSIPSIAACQSLINSMESRCLALVAIFLTFPISRGSTLHKELQVYVFTILKAVQDLCIEVKEKSTNKLQSVGNIWKECEAVQKLPRDNKGAVTSLIQGQLSIVQDALHEIQMNIESKTEEEAEQEASYLNDVFEVDSITNWTDADHHLLPPCIGLIKTAKACLKRTIAAISSNGNLDNSVSIAQLDEVAEICKSSSALVDDFVLSLYPPIEYSSVQEQASLLVDICKKLLTHNCGFQFCKEEDKKSWIAFLQTAVDHNKRKIADLVHERLTED